MDTTGQLLTVLVVDDDHEIRIVIRKFLEAVGCRVLDTGDEEEAVELYRQSYGSVKVLLLDVAMSPGRGARYVLDELDGLLEGVRVILVTGQEPRYALRAFREEEVDDVLRKPFSIARLLEIVAPGPDAPSTPGPGSSPPNGETGP